MNELTRRALLEFIQSVEDAIEAGNRANDTVKEKGKEFKDALKNDDTIVDTRF